MQHMGSYSYADPVVGMVVLRIPEDVARAQHLVPAAGLSRDATIELAQRRERVALALHSSLFFHEWAHILQSAAYPNLYRRAAVHARPLGAFWNAVRDQPQEWSLPLDLQLSSDYLLVAMLEDVVVRLDVRDREIGLSVVDQNTKRRGLITEKDLVEEDAQVFQYRVEIGGAGTGKSYRRWLSEAPRYSRVFSILSQHMSDDEALRLLPRMVRAAFHTSRPLNAFAELMGTILAEGPDLFSDLDDAFTHDLFVDHLHRLYGEVDDDWVDIRVEEPAELAVVGDATHRALVKHTPHLPLHWYAAWAAAEDEPGFLHDALAAPWKHTGRRGEDLTSELARYWPPLMLVLVDHPDRTMASQTLRVSPSLEPLSSDEFDVPVRMLLVETFRGRLLSDVRLKVRPPLARCPHESCQYHGTQLCDGWIPVPKQPEDCQFPEFLRAVTRHDLDVTRGKLVPLTER